MEMIEKRKRLVDYCKGRWCSDCPLNEPVCRCGCGTHFLSKKNERFVMTDEEINLAYAIAFPAEGTEETEGGKMLTKKDILNASAAVMEDKETLTSGIAKNNTIIELSLGWYTIELCNKLFPEGGDENG